MVEKFNTSPEEAEAASRALTKRSIEMIQEAQSDRPSLLNDIWANLGFHMACGHLMAVGVNIPRGAEAEVFISLVLAAAEAAPALRAFEWGANDAEDTSRRLLSNMSWKALEGEEG